MTTSTKHQTPDYSSGDIRVLKDLEHIRIRPGMYIGDTGARGLHNMTLAVIELALEEAREGGGNRIEVTLLADGGCRVLDNGPGIPVEINEQLGGSFVEAIMTRVFCGGKFTRERHGYGMGLLHGVGCQTVNALSRRLVVEVQRDGHLWRQEYQRGNPLATLARVRPTTATGTSITFWPDEAIFKETRAFSYLTFRERFRDLAWLLPELSFKLRDERVEPVLEEMFCTRDGVAGMLREKTRGLTLIHPTVVHGRSNGPVQIEIAFGWYSCAEEGGWTFANTRPTTLRGRHLGSFRQAVLSSIRGFIRQQPSKFGWGIPKGEAVRRGLYSVIAVLLDDPQFGGSLRDHLNNPEVIQPVGRLTRQALARFFSEHPDEAAAILAHIRDPQLVDRKTGE
jgi:DNA gyrase subunit B